MALTRHWSQAGAEFRARLDEEARRYREERDARRHQGAEPHPEPAKPTHPQRLTASDYSHEDYKAGKFWVFDDRLQLSEDDKHHIPVCIDHDMLDGGETTVTFRYLGVIDALDLTAVRRTSASDDFVLIRKATRAEVAATSGIVRRRRRRKKRDPESRL